MAETTAPDISGLNQPGAQAAATPAPSTPESVSPPNLTQGNLPAYGEPGAAAQPSTVVPAGAPAAQPAAPPKHAHLLAMVQGLADGLSAAGTSLATHGREGGAQEVQQLQAQRQASKQSAAAAQREAQSADIENKLKQATTTQINTTIHALNATLPDEIAKSHMSVADASTKLAGEQFNLFAGTGMSPEAINSLVHGGTADAKTSNILQSNAQMTHRIASQLLPEDNPSLANMKAALADPNTPAGTLVQLNSRLQAEMKAQEGVNDAKIKAATVAATAPFGDKAADLNKALFDRYKILNPKATELPQGYALDGQSTSKDFDRVDKIMQQTESAEATQSNRAIVNGMREQMLDLAKGVKIPGDETKSGAEYEASLPVGLQGTIKAIREGREAPPLAGARSSSAQTILSALNHAAPEYDATKYPAYLDVRKKFTGGPEGKGINALNTVETHLSRMFNHANTANTSGGLTGKVTGFFGDKDVQALNIDRTAVSTELSKAYANGQITEGEVKDWEDKLDITKAGMTTGKLITNLKEIDGLLEGKQKAYQTQWNTASPSPSIVSPVPIISSDAAAARANIRGEQPAASAHNVGDSVTLKNGQTVVIKTIKSDGTFTY
jgi:hypothetical protein